jgi:transposase-like protein
MTNLEKQELRDYCRLGLSFEQIRKRVGCADATIQRYIKVFGPAQEKEV